MSILEYTPPPSVEPFLTSDKFQNFIVGPVGSTKTTASIIKIAYEASRMAPCRDGIRRSRCVVLRNTRQMLWDTTIPDFLKWFPNGDAGILHKTDSKFILKLDGVECEVLFRGLDDADDVRRLLSLQLSFGVLDEFREINPDVFNQLTSRLGRYPDGMMVPHRPEWGYDDKGNPVQGCVDDNGNQMKKVWGATNPPDRDSFWEQHLSNPEDNCHVTIQPSGLSPEADWVHHLPSGYYEDIVVGKTEDWIDVYVHGKWGKSLSGMPVFRCFDRDTHVAKTPLIVQPSGLIVGVDAGLNPTAVITQPTYNGRVLVHRAITGTDTGMGALRFIRERLKPALAAEFSGKPVQIVIDPAAFQRAQTDERTVADIYKAEGFVVKPARTNALAARLAVVESYMTRTVDGQAALLINPSETELIKALAGKYRYKINTKGVQDDVPEKSHPWSDYCFVAGTPVLTPNGPVPIEMLGVGDVVCVEDGVDVVSAVGCRKAPTVTLYISDGAKVTCTPDHPFAVKSHTCYVPADALTSAHELVSVEDGVWASGARRTQRKWRWLVCVEAAVQRLRHQLGAWRREKGSTVGENATRTPHVRRWESNTTGCGSLELETTGTSGTNAPIKRPCPSIGTCGPLFMGTFLMGTQYTTGMETQATTTSTTSKFCREENTSGRTWRIATLVGSLKSLMQRVKLPLHGIGPTQDGSGTDSMGKRSSLTVVRKDCLLGDDLVFNLTTSRTHTYYVGTVLVHNCDGLQYACLQHDGGVAFGAAVTTVRREIKPAPVAWARC